jgi:group I intron endonuclease
MWIYKITNLTNNKIYIGQTHYQSDKYMGSGVLIGYALKKYGIENFVKEYIDEALSQEELDNKEKFWIKELHAQDAAIGYNIADGGWNCFTMNNDIKAKISKTLTGKYVGEKAFRKGLTLTQEHKDAISKALKGIPLSEEHKKNISVSLVGKTKSEEHRKKLSMSHTGKTLSDEHKQKISDGGKGRIVTEEHRERLRESNINKTQKHSKTISALCIKTKMEIKFNNISSASRYFGVTRQRVKNNTVHGWEISLHDPIQN